LGDASLDIGHPPQVPEQLSAEQLMAQAPDEPQDQAEAEFASLAEPGPADA
jgi:hypothetical protein